MRPVPCLALLWILLVLTPVLAQEAPRARAAETTAVPRSTVGADPRADVAVTLIRTSRRHGVSARVAALMVSGLSSLLPSLGIQTRLTAEGR